MLDKLKGLGIVVRTPVSVIPVADLAKAEEAFPFNASAQPAPKMSEVVPVFPAKHVDSPIIDKLKQRAFKTVAAEGMEARFNQYTVGIRRRMENGAKKFSLLTVAFDPDTLEMQVVKDEPKRTEAQTVLDLKYEITRRKIV